mgnify:FL=1
MAEFKFDTYIVCASFGLSVRRKEIGYTCLFNKNKLIAHNGNLIMRKKSPVRQSSTCIYGTSHTHYLHESSNLVSLKDLLQEIKNYVQK